jgi:hypothetical protein
MKNKIDRRTAYDIAYYALGFVMVLVDTPLFIFLITIVIMRVFIEYDVRSRE